jgi:hypothetical protein
MIVARPFSRVGADGSTEHYCRECGYTAAFAPSAVARRLRQCAPCARRARTQSRRKERASTIAATLRQREKRSGRVSHLSPLHVQSLLRASRFRSVWQAAAGDARADRANDAANLTIDRINMSRDLVLGNALVLTEQEARMRRARVDPLPPLVRTVASAIAHAVAVTTVECDC